MSAFNIETLETLRGKRITVTGILKHHTQADFYEYMSKNYGCICEDHVVKSRIDICIFCNTKNRNYAKAIKYGIKLVSMESIYNF